MKRSSFLILSGIVVALSLGLAACSITIDTGVGGSAPRGVSVPTAIHVNPGQPVQPQQPVQAAANPVQDASMPGEPNSVEGQVTDPDSSKYASEKRVVTGDSYKANFFERPFTAISMAYLPDVDIVSGYVSSDTRFFYFTLELVGTNAQGGGMQASYGVELDTDKDGRGNYSVWALNPAGTAWSRSNVSVLKDNNHSIGGMDPYIADTSLSFGDGYETVIPFTATEAAWARVNPYAPNIIQIAVHRNLLGNPSVFLWGVWADNGPKNPNQFDYDDHFSYEEAGSPISANQYYPLKKVAAVDNSCRRTYGFNVSYRIPNMCWSGGPVATPDLKPLKFKFIGPIIVCGCPPAPGCPVC